MQDQNQNDWNISSNGDGVATIYHDGKAIGTITENGRDGDDTRRSYTVNPVDVTMTDDVLSATAFGTRIASGGADRLTHVEYVEQFM